MGHRNAVEHVETSVQAVGLEKSADAIGLDGVASHGHDMNIGVGQQRQSTCKEDEVLALLDAAHIQDVTCGQVVVRAHRCQDGFGNPLAEALVAALIDDFDLIGRRAEIMDDVALGTLADGDDAVGIAAGPAELIGIDPPVDGLVIARVAEEDEVVDGDDRLDATCPPDVEGQFAREAMVEGHAVGFQPVCDTPHAP